MEKEHFDTLSNPVPAYQAEDITRIRKALRVSQRRLGIALGVSTRTVEAWEAGRNQPSSTTRRLLYLLDGDHTLLQRLVPVLPPDLIV